MSTEQSTLQSETIAVARAELEDCRRKIAHCVEQLNDQQLWHRAGETYNSIANLLLHLNGNLGERIVGQLGGQPFERNRPAEFAERGPISKSVLLASFEARIAQCDEVLARVTAGELLQTCRFEMLGGPVERSKCRVLWQTLVHLGGHTQEIIALTRLQLGDRYRFWQS